MPGTMIWLTIINMTREQFLKCLEVHYSSSRNLNSRSTHCFSTEIVFSLVRVCVVVLYSFGPNNISKWCTDVDKPSVRYLTFNNSRWNHNHCQISFHVLSVSLKIGDYTHTVSKRVKTAVDTNPAGTAVSDWTSVPEQWILKNTVWILQNIT